MTDNSPTIFISAAEASGDEHAAKLIRAMREVRPNAKFVGAGGSNMAAAGCEPIMDGAFGLADQASMLTGPLFRFGYYYRTVKRLQRAIRQLSPDVHVPVDSPAMNWHLAAAAKQTGAKVVYYIAPQVWAWAPWRVKKLIRLTDHVACILPFEEDWLRRRGVQATFVGHPLFDDLPAGPDPRPDLLEAWTHGKWKVTLLAGSRSSEIKQHSRALAATAAAIRKRWPGALCTFAPGDERTAKLVRASLDEGDLQYVGIEAGRTAELLGESHFAVTVSGTITLEVAHYGVPMVIFYRTNRLAYDLLGRWLIRTPHLSLVNILAARCPHNPGGKRIVPELMPWHGRDRELSSMVLEVMDEPGSLVEMRKRLTAMTAPLRVAQPRSASLNAAELVFRVLSEGR